MHVSEGGVSAHVHRSAESLLKGLSFSSKGGSKIKNRGYIIDRERYGYKFIANEHGEYLMFGQFNLIIRSKTQNF